jgi:hypothetical protein
MIWLLILIVVVVVLVIALAVGHDAPPDAATYRTAVALRAIRRRQEVAQFKGDVRRDAARLRRELRDELDRHDEQRRGNA